MIRFGGWIGAIGAAAVALLVSADAKAGPVDNWGPFQWRTGGYLEIGDGTTILGRVNLDNDLAMIDSYVDDKGWMVSPTGYWGGAHPVLDASFNPILTPDDQPFTMRVNLVGPRFVMINAIPGQEEIFLGLTFTVTFEGPNFSCESEMFEAVFEKMPYKVNPSTREGRFDMIGPTTKSGPVMNCGAYGDFLNSTFNLGFSSLWFNSGWAMTIGPGPLGS